MKKLILSLFLVSLLAACQKQQLEHSNTGAPADAPEYTEEANKMN